MPRYPKMTIAELDARIKIAFDRHEAGEAIAASWVYAARELEDWPARSGQSLRMTASRKRGISLSNGRPDKAVPAPMRATPRGPARMPSALTLESFLEWMRSHLRRG